VKIGYALAKMIHYSDKNIQYTSKDYIKIFKDEKDG